MPYVKKAQNFERINFLASKEYVAFGHLVSDVGVTADASGRKIVKAGTLLPKNDATAQGILFADVDVTEGPQSGALIVEGYILEERLPVAPTTEAKTVLTKITFR